MAYATNDDVRLHWGERGSGTPILLVMGVAYSSRMWYPAIPALSAQHRVIWFDNRGTGASDTTATVEIEALARDAFAVMDAAGVGAAHIYGVSMGGVIVQEMALQQPKRVLSLIVGCSGALTAEKPRAPAFVRLLYRLPPWMLKGLLTIMKRGSAHDYGSAAKPEAIEADRAVVKNEKIFSKGSAAQADALARYCTTHEAIAGLRMPSLVLHGDEDAAVKFEAGEELAGILPDSRFVRFKGAGHNYMVAYKDEANKAVLDFTREVDSATTSSTELKAPAHG
jgi:pimeloyl-ACP methyl ester carboxylesterase